MKEIVPSYKDTKGDSRELARLDGELFSAELRPILLRIMADSLLDFNRCFLRFITHLKNVSRGLSNMHGNPKDTAVK